MNATSFFKLIKAGDQEGLERALRAGYEPDAMCRGLGALHELAKVGPVELLAPLLEHENIYQEAPLTLAKKDAQIEAYLRELLA